MKKTSRSSPLRARKSSPQAIERLRLLMGFALALYLSTHFTCTSTWGCGHAQEQRPLPKILGNYAAHHPVNDSAPSSKFLE